MANKDNLPDNFELPIVNEEFRAFLKSTETDTKENELVIGEDFPKIKKEYLTELEACDEIIILTSN